VGALCPSHWAIIAIVLVVLFGSKKLPDAARGLGRSMRILKTEVGELQADAPELEKYTKRAGGPRVHRLAPSSVVRPYACTSGPSAEP
jgi:sec-independent protein translocase protein TatA